MPWGLADGADRLGLLVGDLHAEALLEVHDQLDQVERVGLQVVAHVRALDDIRGIDVETLDENLLHLAQNLCAISHCLCPLFEVVWTR